MAEREASRWFEYQARLDRVIDYIHDHLDEPLDLNRLAEVACLSPYHWHRIYHGMLGETAAATVRRLRLHRAAGDLVRSERPVREIAEACGFNSVQSFARVSNRLRNHAGRISGSRKPHSNQFKTKGRLTHHV